MSWKFFCAHTTLFSLNIHKRRKMRLFCNPKLAKETHYKAFHGIVLSSFYCHFPCRNSLGDIPKCFLTYEPKCDMFENPSFAEISFMLRFELLR